jgi:hypothetical protein
MGQRNVERHLCGELKEGYLSWRSVQEASISASTERKEKEGNGKRETDTNQQIARSSQKKEMLAGELGKKARRWSCCCTTFAKLAGWHVRQGERKYAIKRVRDTKQKRTPPRWEIDCRTWWLFLKLRKKQGPRGNMGIFVS